jgi:excisionase family DNA binding protein
MTVQDHLDVFLTTEDVLSYLRVNARTVYRLIHAGELPAVRVGRQWRVRRRDLDRFIAAQRIAVIWPMAVNE